MREKTNSFIKNTVILLIVVFLTSVITWQVSIKTFSGDKYLLTKEQYSRFSVYQKIDEMISSVKKNYYGEIDENAMIEGAFDGLIKGIGDPYSEYLSKDDIEKISMYNSGTYSGIGISYVISKENNYPVVKQVYDNGPAREAGILAGDYIIAIDGNTTVNLNSEKIVTMISGDADTTVELTIMRETQELKFTITRKNIDREVVSSRVIENNIGYVQLSTFSGKSAKKLTEEIKKLKNNGCDRFILDLRNNGGGLVDEAIEICDYFMDTGTICYTQGTGGVEEVYKSGKSSNKDTLVVLVNQYSASASEIVAGALKVSSRAKLVGQKTYGKGVVQSYYPLTDGNSSLKLTCSVYYLSNGETPNGVGINPDYEIEMDYNNIGTQNDIQLQKAIDIIK